MNLDDPFQYRTFAATVTNDNGDVAEQSVEAGVKKIGANSDEYRLLWHEPLDPNVMMVTFAISTMYIQDLPRLIKRGNCESIEEVSVEVVER